MTLGERKGVPKQVLREKRVRYFLNDYGLAIPRLRIELGRGGERCLWRDKTTLKAMQDTKRFLEQTWKLDKRMV